MGKTFFMWTSLFIVSLAFCDGSQVPDDPVFDCLKDLTYESLECYKQAHGFSSPRRGDQLGSELGKLVPGDYSKWEDKHTRQRAWTCIEALKKFVGPLKVVVESERRSKFHCNISGHTLEKTLNGLLQNLENSIKDIGNYVRRISGFTIDPSVKPVNMTKMTYLAAIQKSSRGITARKAVQLRNFVLLDYLDQVVSDIKETPGSCFNTKVGISGSCTI